MKPGKSEKRERNRIHILYLLIIFILSCLCGVLAWQYSQQKKLAEVRYVQVQQVTTKETNLTDQLKDLRAQYATLQTNNTTLSTELDAKRARIEELIAEAEKHKGDSYIISKLRKEADELRSIIKHYITQIDSLGRLNDQLVADKHALNDSLHTQKGRTDSANSKIKGLQNYIDKASLLTTMNVKAAGVIISRNGNKEKETTKAKKTDKIKVTFDVAENKITKSGAKTIYVLVYTPDGKELCRSFDNDHKFTSDGSSHYYAAKQNITYQNQAMSVLVYCPKAKDDDELVPGKYIIEVTADKTLIGQTTVTLD